MTSAHHRLDDTFRALADPTRRAVVEALGRGPAAVSDLARPFSMALPSFLQHLKLLEECGLVETEKQGRVRTCRLKPEPLAALDHWLEAQRNLWTRRLDQLDALLVTMAEETPSPPSPQDPTDQPTVQKETP
ncbi:ArsR/SmtB family transcription factor [Phreatobacter oligotrophus]|jgi:DNA-binding transcriptional ArsR family regulator|uniref:ArsR family transcriptional regulator n=1 Tax=Phreatobacter oligotrophus TaxID=1122261 RepID=A0A2T4Z159_9HYPH|nr:metalloregulator ArsR/SmtB family transcription factor [Phreatobacter oligotrophus]PTM53453.1 ArsR family transcriptional regulator [Phreatobacter oligotrophus]